MLHRRPISAFESCNNRSGRRDHHRIPAFQHPRTPGTPSIRQLLVLQVQVQHSDLGGGCVLSQNGKDVEVELSQGPQGSAILSIALKGTPVSWAQVASQS